MTSFQKIILGFLLTYFLAGSIFAQEVIISNTTRNDCDFTLYDTGGVNASGYSANQDFTMTICPDQANQAIVLTWFTFTLGAGDFMEIYDGNSTAAPLLGTYTGTDLNNIVAYASINNTSGCLTLHFVSDGTDNGVFNASVKCEIPCAYPLAGVATPTNPLVQICKGTTVNLDGSNSTAQPGFTLSEYDWDFGDGTNEANTTPTTSHTFNQTGRYIVSLEVKDDNGCKNKNAAFVEVIVETDPVFSLESKSVCEGEIFCLEAGATSPPLPAPAPNMFGQGIHIPDDVGSCFQATQFFNVFPVGSHLTNINQLQSVYANMQHTYIGDLIISIICPSGQSVIMHQQGGGGADLGGDYYWSPTTSNPTWANSGAGGMLPPGTYASVQSLSGLVGCELNGTWTLQICDMWAQDEGDVFGWSVNIDPSLYVDLTALSPTIGSNADSSILSGPGMTYLSSDGDTLCAQQNTAGNYDYTYTVTNSFGCTHDTTVTVTVKPGPIAGFDFDSICLEETANFTNLTQGSVNLFSYSWDFGDGTPTATTFDATHDYTAAGDYAVHLSVDAGNGCTDDSTQIIQVYDEPVADFNFTDDCLYTDPVFTDASSVASGTIETWNWNFGDTTSATLIQSTAESPTHHYVNDGSYDVKLIIITDKNCNDTLIKTTTRYPIPQVDFSFEPECEYDSVTFVNLTTINAPDNISSWVWNYGDGSAFSNAEQEKHKYPQEGDYTITLIATSNHGCIDDTSHTITIYPEPIAAFSQTTVCENGEPTAFTDQSSVVWGLVVGWTWDFDDTQNNTSTLPNPSHDYEQDGDYNVQLIAQTDFGCVDTTENTVTVLAKPTNDFTATLTEYCQPNCTEFSDLTVPNAGSIVARFWSFEENDQSFDSTQVVCFENLSHTDTKTFYVQLITQNNLGCYDTLLREEYITVWPKPLASFEALPPKTNMYETEIEFENNDEGGLTYLWYFGDMDSSTMFDPVHLYPDTGTYEVTHIVTTEYNCKDTTTRNVRIEAVLNVYIPNTFTPNGDGENDTFFLKGYAIVEDDFQFMIFDRWGKMIYFTDSFIPWDGTYKGVPAQQDVYTYKVLLKDVFGKSHEYRGHVNLIR